MFPVHILNNGLCEPNHDHNILTINVRPVSYNTHWSGAIGTTYTLTSESKVLPEAVDVTELYSLRTVEPLC